MTCSKQGFELISAFPSYGFSSKIHSENLRYPFRAEWTTLGKVKGKAALIAGVSQEPTFLEFWLSVHVLVDWGLINSAARHFLISFHYLGSSALNIGARFCLMPDSLQGGGCGWAGMKRPRFEAAPHMFSAATLFNGLLSPPRSRATFSRPNIRCLRIFCRHLRTCWAFC